MLSTKYIIILIIIIIAILFLYNKQENITTTDSGKTLSDEALQTIASVYNTQNLKATNIEATNNIKGKLTGDVTGNVTSPDGNYKLSIDNNGKLHVLDINNKDVNIMGNFTGRFFSPAGNYFAMVHNDDDVGQGILQGYSYDLKTNKAKQGSATASTSGYNLIIPSNVQQLYNDIIIS